jgi:hypothetical protein
MFYLRDVNTLINGYKCHNGTNWPSSVQGGNEKSTINLDLIIAIVLIFILMLLILWEYPIILPIVFMGCNIYIFYIK